MINNIFSATKTAEMLIHDYNLNRVSHAYMIIGTEGSGKRTLAASFAELLLCENPDGITPCGECACCKYFDSFGEHPNVMSVSNTTKATIGVDDIRNMAENVFNSPYIGSKKIYIINNADKMTQQAQNALLKLIEEPPEYAVFFLLVKNRYSMLTTVISRCRVLNMSPYTSNALMAIISDSGTTFTAEEQQTLIHRSAGNPGKLIQLINSDDQYRATVFDIILSLLNNDMEKLFSEAQKIEDRDSAIKLISSINEIMRDAAIYKLDCNKKLIFNSDKINIMQDIAQKSTLKHITSFLEDIKQAIKMLQSNVSYQICIKNLFLKW